MGNSFLEFRGHGFHVRDTPLEIWLRLVTLHLRHRVWLDDAEFHELRETWLNATSGCQGFVGNAADLDRVLASDELVQVAIEASRETLTAIWRLGPKLDRNYLNCLGLPGVFMADLETWKVEQVGATFIQLLSGALPWDLFSSPLIPSPQAEADTNPLPDA